MKRLLASWAGVILLFASIPSLQAERDPDGRMFITGGGQGTFGADLDADGDVDGSYFGVAIARGQDGRSHRARGHFVCAMWGHTDILGLPLMAVEGEVLGNSVRVKRHMATFHGLGTVDLGTGVEGFFTGVPFEVTVTEGGLGVGTLQLTVIGAFDGVAGDTIPGNGNYDLPVETVSSGHIRIH